MKISFEPEIWSPPEQIVFMGFNAALTDRYFKELLEANHEDVLTVIWSRRAAVLKDGTRIWARTPGQVSNNFDGWRFDQIILADDRRGQIWTERAREIQILKLCTAISEVPDEFKILFYDTDEAYEYKPFARFDVRPI